MFALASRGQRFVCPFFLFAAMDPQSATLDSQDVLRAATSVPWWLWPYEDGQEVEVFFREEWRKGEVLLGHDNFMGLSVKVYMDGTKRILTFNPSASMHQQEFQMLRPLEAERPNRSERSVPAVYALGADLVFVGPAARILGRVLAERLPDTGKDSDERTEALPTANAYMYRLRHAEADDAASALRELAVALSDLLSKLLRLRTLRLTKEAEDRVHVRGPGACALVAASLRGMNVNVQSSSRQHFTRAEAVSLSASSDIQQQLKAAALHCGYEISETIREVRTSAFRIRSCAAHGANPLKLWVPSKTTCVEDMETTLRTAKKTDVELAGPRWVLAALAQFLETCAFTPMVLDAIPEYGAWRAPTTTAAHVLPQEAARRLMNLNARSEDFDGYWFWTDRADELAKDVREACSIASVRRNLLHLPVNLPHGLHRVSIDMSRAGHMVTSRALKTTESRSAPCVQTGPERALFPNPVALNMARAPSHSLVWLLSVGASPPGKVFFTELRQSFRVVVRRKKAMRLKNAELRAAFRASKHIASKGIFNAHTGALVQEHDIKVGICPMNSPYVQQLGAARSPEQLLGDLEDLSRSACSGCNGCVDTVNELCPGTLHLRRDLPDPRDIVETDWSGAEQDIIEDQEEDKDVIALCLFCPLTPSAEYLRLPSQRAQRSGLEALPETPVRPALTNAVPPVLQDVVQRALKQNIAESSRTSQQLTKLWSQQRNPQALDALRPLLTSPNDFITANTILKELFAIEVPRKKSKFVVTVIPLLRLYLTLKEEEMSECQQLLRSLLVCPNTESGTPHQSRDRNLEPIAQSDFIFNLKDFVESVRKQPDLFLTCLNLFERHGFRRVIVAVRELWKDADLKLVGLLLTRTAHVQLEVATDLFRLTSQCCARFGSKAVQEPLEQLITRGTEEDCRASRRTLECLGNKLAPQGAVQQESASQSAVEDAPEAKRKRFYPEHTLLRLEQAVRDFFCLVLRLRVLLTADRLPKVSLEELSVLLDGHSEVLAHERRRWDDVTLKNLLEELAETPGAPEVCDAAYWLQCPPDRGEGLYACSRPLRWAFPAESTLP